MFFAGVVADLVTTFPPNDPWRDTRIVEGVAMIDGRRFGTMRDHLDLIPAISPDPSIDVALSAVIEDLDERAAVAITAAFGGRNPAEEFLSRFTHDPETLFWVGSEAIRLAVFRRRCLMGPLDAYAVDTCWWWAEQGYRLDVGETNLPQLDAFSEERIEFETVPEDRYVPDREWIDARLRDMNRSPEPDN